MRFKTQDFIPACGCRSVGECFHGLGAESAALDAMVDAFAAKMKSKLRKQISKGYAGWDDPNANECLRIGLATHVIRQNKGDGNQLVDIANFCAMLWNQNEPSETDAIRAAKGGAA